MRPTLRPGPGSLLFAIGLVSVIAPSRATGRAAIRSAFGPAEAAAFITLTGICCAGEAE
jgi:hypothetical protein